MTPHAHLPENKHGAGTGLPSDLNCPGAIGLADLTGHPALQRCRLCGAPPAYLGLFAPDTPWEYDPTPLTPGKVRAIAYALCAQHAPDRGGRELVEEAMRTWMRARTPRERPHGRRGRA